MSIYSHNCGYKYSYTPFYIYTHRVIKMEGMDQFVSAPEEEQRESITPGWLVVITIVAILVVLMLLRWL